MVYHGAMEQKRGSFQAPAFPGLAQLPGALLPWYQQNARVLPWRADRAPYHVWLSEIIQNALDSGEFAPTSSAKDLMDIYAMFERALLYDWSLVKGKFSLTEKSDALLPHVLDAFVNGL